MDYPRKTEQEQAAFFDEALALSELALEGKDHNTFTICVANTIVRLNFSGDRLVSDLLPALSHLLCQDDGHEDATFNIWDTRFTGVEMVQPPCERNHLTDRGDIWGFDSKRYRTAFHWSDFSVNLFDRERKVGIYWTQDPESLPYWSKCSPMRTLFHWWMEVNGCQLLHAAAVGYESGAVLITGKGGVGKSTTSLACLSNGLKYIADDYMIVGFDPEPTAYSLYSTAKLNADQIEKFPGLRRYITNPDTMDDDKATLYLYPDLKDRIVDALPLKAVVTPSFNDCEETEIRPVLQNQLVGAAAFTTISQLPCVGQDNHNLIVRLVQNVPGFELKLGRDLDGVVAKLDELVRMESEELMALGNQLVGNRSQALPLISVIMPVYNGLEFLSDAIENILSQDYPTLEIIIVDDGSTDDLAGAIKKLPVDVRYFHQDNQGPAAARNRGIKDALGHYIAFLDVDDLWPENNLHTLMQIHQANPELEVVHGHGQLLELDEATGEYEFVGNPEESFPFYIAAGLYKKTAFEKNGLFDRDLIFAEDSDWYNRALENEIPMERYAGVTLHVRRHGGNMTAGKTEAELNPLLAFKKALDRRRAREKAELETE